MNTSLRRYRRPLFESASEQSFSFDRALADELGLDQQSREWQLLSQIGTFWQKYQNCRGQLYPFYETESQLDSLRSRCRVLGQVFPVAITAMEALTDYTVETGYVFQVQSRNDRVSRDFCAACEGILEEFLERENWKCDLDRELFKAARQDGDQAAAVYDVGDGFAEARLIPPEYITEPSDPRAVERWLGVPSGGSWSFGVHTDGRDFQRVHGYYVQWSPTGGDFDYLPAEQVEFIRHNVRRNVKRGLSDFHAVLAWLIRHEKLMRSTSIGAALQSSIAWIEEYAEGTSQSSAESVALGGSTYTYEVSSQGGETRYAEKYEPGQIVGLSKGVKYTPGPMGAERNPNFMLIAQAVARLIGARWAMPEYLITGDASNANYASTMVAESPWVKATRARQEQFGRVQSNLLYRVLNIALRHRRLDSFQVRSLDDLRAAVKIIATAPQVEVRDRLKETQRRQILKTEGVLSLPTFTEEEGYDPKEEKKRGAAPAAPAAPTVTQVAEALWKGYP